MDASRREVMAWLAAAAGVWASGCAHTSGTSDPTDVPRMDGANAERIIVVGAGVAGLTTAQALALAGHDVVVLEARDRIGGRTHTAAVGDASVDLGAAWIHGVNGNPLAELFDAWKLGKTRDNGDYGDVVDAKEGPQSTGRTIQVFAELQRFLNRLPQLRSRLGSEASVADGLAAHLEDRDLAPPLERGLTYAVRSVTETDYAGPAETTSLALFWADEGFGGGDWFPTGGYGALVNALANGLDIRTDAPVSRIEIRDAGVIVHGEANTWSGSHVVITVPLGVLKAGRIAFDPPLPADKRYAIDNMEMGNLEKVILQFDERFWGANDTLMYIGDPIGAWPQFFDVTDVAGAPALACLYGGNWARKVQSDWTDDEIVAGALDALQTVIGSPIPTPAATHVTHWTTDPWAGGSYSYPVLGMTPEDSERLAEPVGERLRFAGEATYWEHASTVHGAFMSGLREASRFGVDGMSVLLDGGA